MWVRGAIAATLASTLILSAILAFGPMPDRADSISAFYTNFRTPAGDLYLLATPVGLDQEPVLVRLNEDGALGSGGSAARVVQATWFATRARAEADLVGALQDAMTFQGQTVALNRMSPQRRRLAESLLTEISRYRHDRADPARRLPGRARGPPRGVGQRDRQRPLIYRAAGAAAVFCNKSVARITICAGSVSAAIGSS